ncbi:MAG: RNA-binding S4 domain-containing protein [Lachnospiraceae bacterium]|nr:RNA-binding S4 domain-containing protein [Lachnospiraceae bacterium]
MKILKIRDKDEYITLGQLLKATDIAGNGVEAKEIISDGEASVNGETEIRRGRKLYDGDTVSCRGVEIKVVR